ncbi:MAG: hypothetical protein IJ192_11050 [Clostridia bacterium]|nr:hypothetical protein [Clostridia bacterium]
MTLKPEDTADLEVDRYHYDIGVVFLDRNYREIIEWAEFDVLPSAGGVDVGKAFMDGFINTSSYEIEDSSVVIFTCSATGGTPPYNFVLTNTTLADEDDKTKTSSVGRVKFYEDAGTYDYKVTAADANGLRNAKTYRVHVTGSS